MNITSLTALIITFHNLAAILMVFIALICTLLSYWLYLRRLENKIRAIAISSVLFLAIGFALAQKLFKEKPIKFEIVQVG